MKTRRWFLPCTVPLLVLVFSVSLLHAQTPADSVTVTFRTFKPASPNVFVPGQFNSWGPNSGGVISTGAPSQMTFDAATGAWTKRYVFKIHDAADSRRTLGDSVFQYKFNQGGTSGGWYTDPSNPDVNASDNNNSVIRLKKLFWFEVNAVKAGHDYTSLTAGVMHDNSAAVTLVQYTYGKAGESSSTVDITSSYHSATSLLEYAFPSAISDSNEIRLTAATDHGDTTRWFFPSSIPVGYLDHPGLMVPYVDTCAAFWLRAEDTTYGGIYTNVDRAGNPITSAGLYKNLVAMSRDAYGMTRAYMLTGNERYLSMARNILDFMYQHHWDAANGGWHASIDRFGNATNATENKIAFDQLYALLGIEAYCEATRDTLDWRWLMAGYQSNENRLWDSRPGVFGYYDTASYNWSYRAGKSFNATVDAITTHALGLYLMTGDAAFANRLHDLARNILDHLVASMDAQVIGFAEHYYTDWTYDNHTSNDNTRTEMGHVLKTAWCLGRLQQILPDTAYLPAAKKLIASVMTKGYDNQLGGPYKDFNRTTGQMLMYGMADTGKAWWQMEQAIMGGIMLYDLTGDNSYLRMARESLEFFMTYFVDHQYGEVYSDRTRYGGAMGGTDKGNTFKAAYHSTETGYYVYLYGKLMLQRQPAILHYKIQSDTADRTFRMNPIALATGRYQIMSVTRDGSPYADFDATARLLHLPPGTGGHFVVTYAPSTPSVATVTLQTHTGWNLVSLPVQSPDHRVSAIAPSAVSSAFAYDKKYLQKDSLFNGRGYWLKFGGSGTLAFAGSPVNAETLTVAQGWNIIGSITDTVPVASIMSIPAGLVTSSVYGYADAYNATTLVVPGSAYWIKASEPGQLILTASPAVRSAAGIRIRDDGEPPPAPPLNEGTDRPAIPAAFALLQNRPNPFNPTTTIRFDLPKDAVVTLAIYNVIGQDVATLFDARALKAGEHAVEFDAGRLSSGVYFYRLVVNGGEFQQLRKMVLLR